MSKLPRFFLPRTESPLEITSDPSSSQASSRNPDIPSLSDRPLLLSPSDSHHIRDVLRLPPGAPLIAVCATSQQEFSARIVALSPLVSVQIEHVVQPRTGAHRNDTLVVSLIKGDRLDFAIEKATELGVCAIKVYQADRSIAQLSEAQSSKKEERWRRVAESAAKQCGRSTLPSIHFFHSLEAAVSAEPRGIFGSLGMNAVPMRMLAPQPPCALVVGPEGGLTDDEITLLMKRDFLPVSLGSLVLRAETAAMVIVSSAIALWGESATHEVP